MAVEGAEFPYTETLGAMHPKIKGNQNSASPLWATGSSSTWGLVFHRESDSSYNPAPEKPQEMEGFLAGPGITNPS